MENLLWILVAPILIGIWAIPVWIGTVPFVLGATVIVWARAFVITKVMFGWPILDEYTGIGFGLTVLPVLYAYTIGALTQLVARITTQPGSTGEANVRLAGCACLALGPIYLYFA